MRSVLPRRTVRMRLPVLYGALFVVSGAVLLAITSGVVVSSSRTTAVGAHQAVASSPLARDQVRIDELQTELANAEAQIHSGLSHGLLVGSAIALGIMA